MRKKRECDASALAIVEQCLEPVESPDEFLLKVKGNLCFCQETSPSFFPAQGHQSVPLPGHCRRTSHHQFMWISIVQGEDREVSRELEINRSGLALILHALPSSVPKKQYHISTATNKVYDITERKNFCSSSCFKSSNYLKIQLLTSPLWLRDVEDIPEFKMLSLE